MSQKRVIVIEAGVTQAHYWSDLFYFRELFYVLAWRDVAIRYKQTVIGAAWTVIQPLLTVGIFTLTFGKFANLAAEGTGAYTLMVFIGLLPWQLFSTGLIGASHSLIDNSNLISKVYFPRLIIPGAALVVAFVDFLLSLVVLFAMMAWHQRQPCWRVLFLPFFVAMAVFASLGLGLLLSSLNVRYRDFRYVIPFAVQLGLYVSPVGFSTQLIPEKWRLFYSLNPIVCIIDGCRWAILRDSPKPPAEEILLGVAVISFLLWLGIRQFRKMERGFADII